MRTKVILSFYILAIFAAALSSDAATNSIANSSTKANHLKTQQHKSDKKNTKLVITPPSPKFTGSVNVARYGSMIDHQDGSRFDSIDTMINLGYMIGDNYKIGSQLYYSHNLKKEDGDWDEVNLFFSRIPKPLYSRLLFSPALLGMAPMSKDAIIRQEYQGGIGAGARFSFEPGTFVGGLDFKFSFSLFRNFFEHETATDGKPNSEYSSIQKFVALHTYKKISTSIAFFHINSLSYQNNIKESFMHFEEIGYNFNPTITVAIGHGNIGSALKPNGQDNNILLINENSSVIYASTTVNF